MSFAGFKMWPACCCGGGECNIFYGASVPSHYELSGSTLIQTNAVTAGVTTQALYFDYVNETVYMVKNEAKDVTIVRYNDDLSSRSDVFTVTAGLQIGPSNVAAYPDSEHIFYGAKDDPLGSANGYLRRVNYDGTGDTLLVTFTNPGSVSPASINESLVSHIIISRPEEYVFYVRQFLPGGSTTPDIRRCNSDGTGDVQVWDSAGAVQVRSLAINNTLDEIFWGDSDNVIRRASFDGTGAITIFTSSTDFPGYAVDFAMRLAGWDHAGQRLYFWAGRSGGTDDVGYYSILRDGTDLTAHAVYPDVGTETGAQLTKLGCGLDTDGS